MIINQHFCGNKDINDSEDVWYVYNLIKKITIIFRWVISIYIWMINTEFVLIVKC